MEKPVATRKMKADEIARNCIFAIVAISMPASLHGSRTSVHEWALFVTAYLFLISNWFSFYQINKRSNDIEQALGEESRSKFWELRQVINVAGIMSFGGIGIAFAIGMQLSHR